MKIFAILSVVATLVPFQIWAGEQLEASEVQMVTLESLENESLDSGPLFHVILDLDLTLVRYQPGWNPLDPRAYKLAHGCREFLEYLARRDDIRITFFSGACEERNQPLVQRLLEPIEAKLGKKIPHKILSSKHLIRNRKDIRLAADELPSEERVKMTLLLDDNIEYVRLSQAQNWIPLYPRSSVNDYYPLGPNNALIQALGTIVKVIEIAKMQRVPDLRIPLHQVQNCLKYDVCSHEYSIQLIELGLDALQTVNPSFRELNY